MNRNVYIAFKNNQFLGILLGSDEMSRELFYEIEQNNDTLTIQLIGKMTKKEYNELPEFLRIWGMEQQIL